MSYVPIRTHIEAHNRVRAQLLQRWPELDDETLDDTLEGITSLHGMIAEVVRSALVDQALANGLKGRLEDMKLRLERLQTRAQKKRTLALSAMVEADIKRLTEPDFTVSLRAGMPGLVVTSEDEVPAEYWVPQPAKLDRQALLAALKSGRPIEGVALSNPEPSISVRTK